MIFASNHGSNGYDTLIAHRQLMLFSYLFQISGFNRFENSHAKGFFISDTYLVFVKIEHLLSASQFVWPFVLSTSWASL